jgi:hypothetical protein
MDEDIESEVAKVEVGDNFVIISDELENGEHFMSYYVISHYIDVRPHLKTIGETNGMRVT